MSTRRKALITGITGQDGSYLAEHLVHEIVRRSSSFNTARIDHLYRDPHESGVRLFTHYGDLSDPVSLTHRIYELQPDEIYNLGAQSHVRVSFQIPEYSLDITGAGTLRMLDAARESGRGGPRLPIRLLGDVRRLPAAATGELHSVREFATAAFEHAGLGDFERYVEIDPRYYRPTEVDALQGDPAKAKRELGWEPEVGFDELAGIVVEADITELEASLAGKVTRYSHEGTG